METSLQRERRLDAEAEKEKAINVLAEQLACASLSAVGEVAKASVYEFDYKFLMNSTNGSEEFYEMFHSIAKKLINSVG